MINQDLWLTTLLAKQIKFCPPLNQYIWCVVLTVRGGFAGVSAAAKSLRKAASLSISSFHQVL